MQIPEKAQKGTERNEKEQNGLKGNNWDELGRIGSKLNERGNSRQPDRAAVGDRQGYGMSVFKLLGI